MINLPQIAKNFGGVISKNSPHILTALGCTGVLGTAVLAGKASIRAYQILETEGDLTGPEIVQHTWKIFVPPVAMGAVSIACIIGANAVNAKRNAALAALYSLSETAFREYKTKVVEQIGKTKETQVRDAVARDRIANSPVDNSTIIVTGNGDVLCYDKLCDRYFTSSYETIRQKVNDLNYELLSDMWLDLNDLYYALGLPSSKLGDQMGFDLEKGKIELDYSTQLDPSGRPCLVIDTTVYPKY